LLALLLSAGPGSSSTPDLLSAHLILGRAPVDSVTSITSARFVSSDMDDILAIEKLGRIRLPAPGPNAAQTSLVRLNLLRLAGERFHTIWQSEPLLETAVPAAQLSAGAWAVGDIDQDGLDEILLFTPESCRVISFGPESTSTRVLPMPGAWVTDAALCDLVDDSVPELVTLELSPLDPSSSGRLVRTYRFADSALVPASDFAAGLDWGPDASLKLLGACRLPEYWGRLPVVAGIYPDLRPSAYAVVVRTGDSLRVTSHPFPLLPWFSKEHVLPSGPLSLYNVGDTLVARGYFVPGTGRSNSFAALQDGEWRLLRLTDAAHALSGPTCRFTLAGQPGWLELRDNIIRFFPGEVFPWR